MSCHIRLNDHMLYFKLPLDEVVSIIYTYTYTYTLLRQPGQEDSRKLGQRQRHGHERNHCQWSEVHVPFGQRKRGVLEYTSARPLRLSLFLPMLSPLCPNSVQT